MQSGQTETPPPKPLSRRLVHVLLIPGIILTVISAALIALYLADRRYNLFMSSFEGYHLPRESAVRRAIEAFRQGYSDRAAVFLARTVRQKKVHPYEKGMAYSLLGEIYYRRREYLSAADYYAKGADLTKDTASRINEIQAYLRAGKEMRALKEARALVRTSPEEPDAYGVLAHIYFYQKNGAELASLYRKTEGEPRARSRVLSYLLLIYLQQGRAKEAADLMENSSDDSRAAQAGYHALKGYVYAKNKKYETAAEEFAAAIGGGMNRWDLYFNHAVCSLKARRTKRALAMLRRIKPDDVPADFLLRIAEVYYRSRADEDTERLLRRILKKEPKNTTALLMMSDLVYRREREHGEYDRTILLLREVLRQETAPLTETVKARYNLGVVRFAQGYYERAEELFTAVVGKHTDKNPHYQGLVKLNLLMIQFRKDEDHRRIREMTEQLLTEYPASVEANLLAGEFAFRQGRYREAVMYFKRVDDGAQDPGLVVYYLGDAYRRMGRYRKAQELYVKLRRFSAYFDRAWNNLIALKLDAVRLTEEADITAGEVMIEVEKLADTYAAQLKQRGRPETPYLLANRGIIFFQRQLFADAADTFYRAALTMETIKGEKRPADGVIGTIYYYAGRSYVRAGKQTKAYDAFEKAYRLTKDSKVFWELKKLHPMKS